MNIYNDSTNRTRSTLIALIPLIFILMPRPAITGVQFMTYPLIFVFIVLMVLATSKEIKINKNIFIMYFFLLVSTLLSLLSMLINSSLSATSLAKPLLFGSLLYFGYFIAKNNDIHTIKNGLLKVSYVVILVQAVVGLTQLFDIHVFSFLYSMEKTRPFGEIVRISGTLGNPNFFSWILMQVSVILVLFEKNNFKKITLVGIVLALIFLSGSRSSLLLFPVVILFTEIMSKRKTPVFFFFKLPLYALGLFIALRFIYWFIYTFGNYFPYMYQLLDIFETGDFSSINSVEGRTLMWEMGISQITTATNWLFGLGPGHISSLDNDYLYAIINSGLLYLIVNITMYLFAFYLFTRIRDRKFKVLGIQYILFSFIIGVQADTLSGWNYPVLIMFYTGIAISIISNKNVVLNDEMIIKKKRRLKITW